MKKIKIFISSALKELMNERLAVKEAITDNEFLNRYFDVEMWEGFPPMAVPSRRAYLEKLKECDIYIGLFGNEYGTPEEDGLSPTEREYRQAKADDKYILVFLKGKTDTGRDEKLKDLLKEFKGHRGYSYKRFENYIELKDWTRKGLSHYIKKKHDIEIPTGKSAVEPDKTSSNYDRKPIINAPKNEISLKDAEAFFKAAGLKLKGKAEMIDHLRKRSMLHFLPHRNLLVPTVAGLLLFGKHPQSYLPQSKIKADAFQGTEPGNTIDQKEIMGALFDLIKGAEAFFLKNMKTAARIEGFSRVQISEYPIEALREAVINAIAHRDYGISGAAIMIQIFTDRIVIASPGLLPEPLTLEMVRAFKYRPKSRNSIIASALFDSKFMEERGGGFKRMHDMMVNYGLKPPSVDYESGYFTVTFYGPEDILKLNPSKLNVVFEIPSDRLSQLTKRQKDILKFILDYARVSSEECTREFGITRDTANRDFKRLMELALIEQRGAGRSTHYVIKE
ncbi:MAG: ATP-binding protein [Thermodesulfovibrionales bacterium]|jgi:predicted HTH transcriptional regulator